MKYSFSEKNMRSRNLLTKQNNYDLHLYKIYTIKTYERSSKYYIFRREYKINNYFYNYIKTVLTITQLSFNN